MAGAPGVSGASGEWVKGEILAMYNDDLEFDSDEFDDLVLGLVHDPSAHSLERQSRTTVGDGSLQAEVDFADANIRASVERFSSERLERIERWQREIKLSVLPLSAGEETLPQLRQLMGAQTPTRRVR